MIKKSTHKPDIIVESITELILVAEDAEETSILIQDIPINETIEGISFCQRYYEGESENDFNIMPVIPPHIYATMPVFCDIIKNSTISSYKVEIPFHLVRLEEISFEYDFDGYMTDVPVNTTVESDTQEELETTIERYLDEKIKEIESFRDTFREEIKIDTEMSVKKARDKMMNKVIEITVHC